MPFLLLDENNENVLFFLLDVVCYLFFSSIELLVVIEMYSYIFL